MVELLPDKKRVERFTFDEVCQFNATKAEIEKKKSKKWKNQIYSTAITPCPVFLYARALLSKISDFWPLENY